MHNDDAIPRDAAGRPLINRLGTVECDLVESNPVVWQGRLLRFDSVRAEHRHNPRECACYRFVDMRTGAATAPFADGYKFGCAAVVGERMIVTGARADGSALDLFESTDLERWDRRVAVDTDRFPAYYNSSLCHDGTRFVLLFEVNGPYAECGPPFTARFAVSPDLVQWELTGPECVYARDRYTAPHCLRWHDGWYYLFYLEQYDGFGTRIARSRDLREWRTSWLDPVMKATDADRAIANPRLTAAERRRIATAVNRNNSDIDMIEYEGRLVITYSWGSQLGVEHLALAEHPGPLGPFLAGWFPGQ